MNTKFLFPACVVTAVVAAGCASSGSMQDDGMDNDYAGAEASRCVDLRSVDRTEIVNDRTILFYMRDKSILQNRLSHSCPGLRRGQPYMFSVSINQLCDLDTITLLDEMAFGFMQGATCGLGTFTPVSADEALRMTARSDAADAESLQ